MSAKLIEIRVRPVTRYIVTRYTEYEFDGKKQQCSELIGEFDNERRADEVSSALCVAQTQNSVDQHGNLHWFQPDTTSDVGRGGD